MVVRGSGPSHYGALDAHAQVRVSQSSVSTGCHYVAVALTNSIIPLGSNFLSLSGCFRLCDGGRFLAECFAAAHHRPRDPRHLVGDRDRDHARWTPLKERVDPGCELGLVAAIAARRWRRARGACADTHRLSLKSSPYEPCRRIRTAVGQGRSKLPDAART
jgi:hypothetical protein